MHIRFSTTLLAAAAAAALLSLTAPAQALDVATVKPQLETEINADYPHLFDIYKDIHQHPELGHQETRTAAKLAGEMRALGLRSLKASAARALSRSIATARAPW